MKHLLAVLCAVVACTDPVLEPPAPSEALAILFLGNSLTYSNDMPEILEDLLSAQSDLPVIVESVSFPNYGLQDHWVDSRSHAAIARGGWDYVVLQQGPSATEGRPSLLEYTTRFAEEITAVGATPAHFMVWPAASRSFDFDGVSASYSMAAQSVGGVLFPAGEAWRAAWREDPSLGLYGPDDFHPSVLGSFVAALTIADRLIGPGFEPSYVIDTPSQVTSIDSALGAMLLAAVREANEKFR